MQSWWSKIYNRPLKDPLLQTYTLEELLYEFYDKIERNLAEGERKNKEEVQVEEAKEQEVLDWIDEEERKEAENTKKPLDPTKDPENIKWMEEQIKAAKAQFGDDFGEDLELNFDEKR